jgi:FtsZ-interacting cell division protein ZipA
MKHALAGALLIAGLIAAAPASAQLVPAEKCYDCPTPRDHYDTQETIRTTTDVDHSRVIETQSEAPVPRWMKGVQRPRSSTYDTRSTASRQAKPALRARAECVDCPKPRDHYDTQETIRNTQDVDQSRVIETQSEEQVSRRVKETNHLVIRENETRNVGVVQHNHTIIERVPRYVVRVPAVTTVSFVTHNYRVVETPATMTVPVQYRPARRCAPGRRSGTDDTCRRLLRVRG